jgi:ACR3 family arsenite efflux pump ArsB
VVLCFVVPAAVAQLWRRLLAEALGPVSMAALLLTLVLPFALQGSGSSASRG